MIVPPDSSPRRRSERLLASSVTVWSHVHEPFGTTIVSPSAAPSSAACTSAIEHEAAVMVCPVKGLSWQVGPTPPPPPVPEVPAPPVPPVPALEPPHAAEERSRKRPRVVKQARDRFMAAPPGYTVHG